MSNNNIFITIILYLSLFQTSTCSRSSWGSWSSRSSWSSSATCSGWKSFDHPLNLIDECSICLSIELNLSIQISIDLNLQIMNLIINSTMMSKILTSCLSTNIWNNFFQEKHQTPFDKRNFRPLLCQIV